jgi:predicted phosphohydrolase
MDRLVLIQVSDPHLRAGSRDWYEWFPTIEAPSDGGGALADAVSSRVSAAVVADKDVCLGILSGDVSLLGKPADLDMSLGWWNALVPAGSAFVLGNHDFWNGRIGHTFLTHATAHWQVRATRWPAWPVRQLDPVDLPGLRIRIYELDTTPLNPWINAAARGTLSALETNNLLAAADEDAAADAESPVLRIAVAHHPVSKMRRGHVVQVLQRAQIGLFLVGHTHHFDMTREGPGRGVVQTVCASSTITDPPSFLVHLLEPGPAGVATLNTTRVELFPDGAEQEVTLPPVQVALVG